MSSRRGLVLVLLLTVLALIVVWQLGWLSSAPPASALAPKPPPPPGFESAWTTEVEWLVDSITRDVREMAVYATTGSLPADPLPQMRPEAIHFEDHLFSPRAYEAVAREALGPSLAPDVPSPPPTNRRTPAS